MSLLETRAVPRKNYLGARRGRPRPAPLSDP
jgi:hypothetical protein